MKVIETQPQAKTGEGRIVGKVSRMIGPVNKMK